MRGLMRRVLLGLTNLACRAWLDQPGLTALALVFFHGTEFTRW